jgi:hypothetical protein
MLVLGRAPVAGKCDSGGYPDAPLWHVSYGR